MMWRILIIVALVAIVAGGVVWIIGGTQTITRDKEEVVTMSLDPVFGDTVKDVKFVDKYQLGLLPPSDSPMDAPNSYAFILGTGAAAIVLSVVMMRRARRRIR